MSITKAHYAKDANGKLIDISMACRGQLVRCPVCNGKLVVRKGDIRDHHFAHKGGSNCSPESVLHMVAKSIVANAKAINGVDNKPISIMNGRVEKFLCPGVIADVVIDTHTGDTFGVEICVSHPKSEEDIDKLRKNHAKSIEIRLSVSKSPKALIELEEWILKSAPRRLLPTTSESFVSEQNCRRRAYGLALLQQRLGISRGRETSYTETSVKPFPPFEEIMTGKSPYVSVKTIVTESQVHVGKNQYYTPDIDEVIKDQDTKYGWSGRIKVNKEGGMETMTYPFFYLKTPEQFIKPKSGRVYATINWVESAQRRLYQVEFHNIGKWIAKLARVGSIHIPKG